MHTIQRGVYRHYKGGEYIVLGVGRHEATHEEYIIYRALYTAEDDKARAATTDRERLSFGDYSLWLRPLANFLEEVDEPDYNYKGPRFRLVKPLE